MLEEYLFMKLFEKFKHRTFWVETLKLGGVFFILFVVISMILANAGAFFSGNFGAVIEAEWGEGRWRSDIPLKLAITLIYAVYMTSRRWNMKKQ